MEICFDNEQQWLEQRLKGIGATDAAIILGVSPWKSAYTLWAEKSGLTEPADLSQNEAVEWGKTLEPLIAGKYAQKTGRKLLDPGRFTVQVSDKMPWQQATLDRIIAPKNGNGAGVLEIKTTGAQHADQWEDDPPLLYQIQLQHQLAVTGYQWGSLAALIGGQKFRFKDMPADKEFIEILMEKEAKFWDMVQKGIPPEVDATESTAETLKELYKADTGETIALPGIAIEWDAELTTIKESLKQLEERKTGVENLLKAEIKDASKAVLPNGVIYTLKTSMVEAKVIERPAYSFRALRRSEPKGKK